MKKMPCLFVRDFKGPREFTITEEVTPGCEWVLRGEGIATRKWDGTACAVIGGEFYKRYDAKKDRKTGEYKKPPEGAIPCDEPDPVTGHWPHWVKVSLGPEDKYLRAFWTERRERGYEPLEDGTYEFVGPSVNGNHEQLSEHHLQAHLAGTVGSVRITYGHYRTVIPLVKTPSFQTIRLFLEQAPMEGIVFHHPDGRMCKIRRHDFGFAWPARNCLPQRGPS